MPRRPRYCPRPDGWHRRSTHSMNRHTAARAGRQAPRTPASSRARRLWQAVTPEPHMATSWRCSPSTSSARLAAISAASRKRPSASRLAVNGRLTAPGICPARVSMGSTCPAKRCASRASSSSNWPAARPRLNLSHAQHGHTARLDRVAARKDRGLVLRYRQARRHPGRVASVKHGCLAMAHPAQQPPQARRDRAARGIIGHHRRLRRYAPGPKQPGKTSRIGQRMPPAPGTPRCSQVPVEIRVKSPRYVAGRIGFATGGGTQQIEATIDHDEVRRADARGQLVGIQQNALCSLNRCRASANSLLGPKPPALPDSAGLYPATDSGK